MWAKYFLNSFVYIIELSEYINILLLKVHILILGEETDNCEIRNSMKNPSVWTHYFLYNANVWVYAYSYMHAHSWKYPQKTQLEAPWCSQIPHDAVVKLSQIYHACVCVQACMCAYVCIRVCAVHVEGQRTTSGNLNFPTLCESQRSSRSSGLGTAPFPDKPYHQTLIYFFAERI